MKRHHTKKRNAARQTSSRKERMTFSLSADSADFLRAFRKQQRAPSLSALVEVIVENLKRSRELAELEASVTAYYNANSEKEMQEESAWGELGAASLAAFESEAKEKSPLLADGTR
jgi:hypothetical protein